MVHDGVAMSVGAPFGANRPLVHRSSAERADSADVGAGGGAAAPLAHPLLILLIARSSSWPPAPRSVARRSWRVACARISAA